MVKLLTKNIALDKGIVNTLTKASTSGSVGIGEGGSLNNTNTEVLILGEGGKLEAPTTFRAVGGGVELLATSPHFSPREANAVVVGGVGWSEEFLTYYNAKHPRGTPLGAVTFGGTPSLVKYVPSSNSEAKNNSELTSNTYERASNTYEQTSNVPAPVGTGTYSRTQKRGYHRCNSILGYWLSNGYQVLWLALTTASEGSSSALAYHHQRLRQKVERKFRFEGLEHYQIRTSEGNGVLHAFWAWKPKQGFRSKLFYIKQAWLSEAWHHIHGAKVVWIAKVKGGRATTARLSRYCMSQYCGGQSGYEYMSWSWKRSFGFPLVACWYWLKRTVGNRHYALRCWVLLLASRDILVGRFVLSMAIIRAVYQEYGSLCWGEYSWAKGV